MTALAAASVLALGAAGCSGDSEETEDSGEGSAEETPTAEELDPEAAAALEEAVRAYTTAFFAPDAEAAYALISERCQGEIDLETYTTQVEQAAETEGQLSVQTFEVAATDENAARVTYSVGVPVLDERLAGQLWILENDAWVFDAC